MYLIQQSKKRIYDTTVREVENVLEYRNEREGQAGRDERRRREREEGMLKALILKGIVGGKG